MAVSFPVGSVGHSLHMMNGVWHDHIETFNLDGTPLVHDPYSGTPGDSPFDNLVYIDFDGEHYKQTNVTFKGRPLHIRSFAGKLIDGVLVFNKLGPDAPEHIGMSGGYGILIYAPRRIDDAWQRYSEPDWIKLEGNNQRVRTTVLYKNGIATRTLTAIGYKIAPTAERRVAFDPRGAEGDVHNLPSETLVYKKK